MPCMQTVCKKQGNKHSHNSKLLSMAESASIVVLGAGAWGTALAIQLARAGQQVILWAHGKQHAEQLALQRENQRYLPGYPFPSNLTISQNFATDIINAQAILVAVPSSAFRETLVNIQRLTIPGSKHLAWATKGFESGSNKLLHQVAAEVLSKQFGTTVVSGPTFAEEVAKGMPTAMVSASDSSDEASYWADAFHHGAFRVYTQQDMAGVEVGGAYKNIMAIATGVSDGLGLGVNARAAIVSRGMSEMITFASLFKANPATLMGLAGLGDLVLTCTDNLSRNRRFGLNLAKTGKSVETVLQEIGQVVEGVKAVKVVQAIAKEQGLNLPIAEQVFQLVLGKINTKQAAKNLLARDLKSELK